jgi:hypothetical protein
MSCETYREALIDAAASGTAPVDALSAHLQICAECRAALAEEQALFASVDAGLHAAANTEVPPSLVARVRAQLNFETAPRRSWVPAWLAIAAAAALVLLALSVRTWRSNPGVQNPSDDNSARTIVPPELPNVAPGGIFRTSPVATTSKQRHKARAAPPERLEPVSVLLPPGRKEMVDRWLEELQQGKFQAEVLLAEKPEQPLHELQVSPLGVSPIEVKPLANVGSDSEPDENARP